MTNVAYIVAIVIKNQTLLQAAWAGDAVTVKKCLVGYNQSCRLYDDDITVGWSIVY